MKKFLAAASRPETVALVLILLVAAALRLEGVGFGLPALYDPDEPLFVMTALELLRSRSLNPHWFGHPGTTTIYTLAAIDIVVILTNVGSARYPTTAAFATAIYADPGIVFLPGRVFIALCGVSCVYLTYRLGRTLFSARIGLIAAGLLAIDSLHIRYSQLIRTDMHATVFILLGILSMVGIARSGKLRHYVMAGIWIGLACATKWPSAIFAIGLLGVAALRIADNRDELRRQGLGVVLFGITVVAALVAASPYLLLDYPTVLTGLHAEGRSHHPGHTGAGWFANLEWYVGGPLFTSFALPGLAAVIFGSVLAFRQSNPVRYIVIPAALLFLATISGQALVWERWLTPVLPLLALFIAITIGWCADRLGGSARRFRGAGALALILTPVAIPMLWTTWLDLRERRRDTRDEASAWLRHNVPHGKTVMVEHGAIDLLFAPYHFIFPVGDAGCVDARAALAGKIRYSRVDGLRSHIPVLDLGGVPAAALATCRADYAIFTHYDAYLTEPAVFKQEISKYRALARSGTVEAVFYPQRGIFSGPIVHVVKLARTR